MIESSNILRLDLYEGIGFLWKNCVLPHMTRNISELWKRNPDPLGAGGTCSVNLPPVEEDMQTWHCDDPTAKTSFWNVYDSFQRIKKNLRLANHYFYLFVNSFQPLSSRICVNSDAMRGFTTKETFTSLVIVGVADACISDDISEYDISTISYFPPRTIK